MTSQRNWAALIVTPLCGALLAALGCGGGGDDEFKPGKSSSRRSSSSSTSGGGGSTATPAAAKTPVKGNGVATVKGRVVFDGAVPARKSLAEQIEKSAQKDFCMQGDTMDPTWIVSKSGGVKDAVVWLRAPAGSYFEITDGQKRPDAIIDQPRCAFEPHVQAYNPTVYDAAAKKQKASGTELLVKNSAPVPHNTAWSGKGLVNPGGNETLSSGGTLKMKLKANEKEAEAGGEELVNISCDIHKWMTAKAAIFDHPFYAVTDADGNFEIKNVPADTNLELVVWHETFGSNLKRDGKKKDIKLKAGDNTEELKIK